VNINTANPQVILTLICQPNGAPEATVCTDPVESAKLLGALNMVHTFTAGAPIFGSPKSFAKALKGTGMFGEIMKMLQIQPIQLKSEEDFLKGVTTESKVFGIYATGYVRAGKRETRTRIHAVVDFRDAPPPGVSAMELEATKEVAAALDPTGTATQQINAALKPSPGGKIIYYRVD
jgi:general secretion pathway protein K